MHRSFVLDCGREVYLSSLHFMYTYDHILLGKPTGEHNESLIELARGTSSGRYLVDPAVDARGLLPRVKMIAQLWCNDPIGSDGIVSRLTVIWFRQTWDWEKDSLVDVVHAGIHAIDWDAFAEDD